MPLVRVAVLQPCDACEDSCSRCHGEMVDGFYVWIPVTWWERIGICFGSLPRRISHMDAWGHARLAIYYHEWLKQSYVPAPVEKA
jgi:hypothetical protein